MPNLVWQSPRCGQNGSVGLFTEPEPLWPSGEPSPDGRIWERLCWSNLGWWEVSLSILVPSSPKNHIILCKGTGWEGQTLPHTRFLLGLTLICLLASPGDAKRSL